MMYFLQLIHILQAYAQPFIRPLSTEGFIWPCSENGRKLIKCSVEFAIHLSVLLRPSEFTIFIFGGLSTI